MLKSVPRVFSTAAPTQSPQYSEPKLSSSVVICRPSTLFLAPYDYQLLLLKRKSSTRAFAHVLAFPGGRVEESDSQLSQAIGAPSVVLSAATRELFEQTGIFLSKKPIVAREQLQSLTQLAQWISRDVLRGRTTPSAYYEWLCRNPRFEQDLEIDELIRLITIPSLPHRYDTYFYLKMLEGRRFVNIHNVCQRGIEKLEGTDDLVLDEDEHESFLWANPVEVLALYFQKKVKLAPPQFIILNILSKHRKFALLKQYLATVAAQRQYYPALQTSPLFFPQIVNLVANTVPETLQRYPFAAAFVGDKDFAYDKLIKNEKSSSLRGEMQLYKQIFGSSTRLNRILFQDPNKMFEADYSVSCEVPFSLLQSMASSEEIKKRIEDTA